MTIHQYNTLKWINSVGWITDKQLRKCHMGNIGSLAKNKWIVHSGHSTKVSPVGHAEMNRYKYRLQRKFDADISERVQRLLHLGKILYFRRVA